MHLGGLTGGAPNRRSSWLALALQAGRTAPDPGGAGVASASLPGGAPIVDRVDDVLLALLRSADHHPDRVDPARTPPLPDSAAPDDESAGGSQHGDSGADDPPGRVPLTAPGPHTGREEDGGFEAFLRLARTARVPSEPSSASPMSPEGATRSDALPLPPSPAPAPAPAQPFGGLLAVGLAGLLRPTSGEQVTDPVQGTSRCPEGRDPCREPTDLGRCRRCGPRRSRR